MEPIEEQTTWKGHAFTLVVFSGIVVLCAIFFILGMLVGRTQGQKVATDEVADAAAAETAAVAKTKATAAAQPPELTFFESVDKNEPAPLEPQPPRSRNAVNFQIAAVRQSADAENILNEVKQKGFRAFVLAPPPGGPNPYFRIQVGPFTDQAEVKSIKLKLESAGYKPIVKR